MVIVPSVGYYKSVEAIFIGCTIVGSTNPDNDIFLTGDPQIIPTEY